MVEITAMPDVMKKIISILLVLLVSNKLTLQTPSPLRGEGREGVSSV
jgi:hypothetical protein